METHKFCHGIGEKYDVLYFNVMYFNVILYVRILIVGIFCIGVILTMEYLKKCFILSFLSRVEK